MDIDTVQEDLKPALKWSKATETKMPYEHRRPLPKATAQKALDYIAVLTAQYPVQMRYAMALPLWYRFAQEWCDTGSERESLRVI